MDQVERGQQRKKRCNPRMGIVAPVVRHHHIPVAHPLDVDIAGADRIRTGFGLPAPKSEVGAEHGPVLALATQAQKMVLVALRLHLLEKLCCRTFQLLAIDPYQQIPRQKTKRAALKVDRGQLEAGLRLGARAVFWFGHQGYL